MNEGKVSVVQWIILIVLGLGIVTESIYIASILGAPATPTATTKTITNSPITQIKNTVVNVLSNAKIIPQTNSGFKVQTPIESGKNTYTFMGSFVGVDNANSLILIKDDSGKIYSFKINNYIQKDTDTRLMIYTVPNIDTFAKGIPVDARSTPRPDQKNLLTSGMQINLTVDPHPQNLNEIIVRWNDTRSLAQIKSDFEKDPNTPINATSPDNIVLAQIK